MAIYRTSLLFAVTTNPENSVVASAHSGGWSEGFWSSFIAPQQAGWRNLIIYRAALLPSQCSIVGYRVATYNVIGNQLQPAGTASGKMNAPGNAIYTSDVPQAGLEISMSAAGVPNTSRPVLRGIPSQVIERGEWAPDQPFQQFVGQLIQTWITNQYGFVGRQLTQPSVRVNAIAGGVITTTRTACGCSRRLHSLAQGIRRNGQSSQRNFPGSKCRLE